MSEEFKLERPYMPAVVRDAIQQRLAKKLDIKEIDRGLVGVTVGSLNRACGSDENRYIVLFFLLKDKWEKLDDVSTKTMTPAEWLPIAEWVGAYKDEEAPKGQQWKYHEALEQECAWILNTSVVRRWGTELDYKEEVEGDWDLAVNEEHPEQMAGDERDELDWMHYPPDLEQPPDLPE